MKKIFAMILAVCVLLSTCAFAATKQETWTADALAHLRLFRGKSTTAKDYALDDGLNRAEGVVLLIRILGKEDTAQTGGDFGMPFADTKTIDWCKGHVGYAWKNGITNGISTTAFGPMNVMQDNMFLTLVLRAMDYKDSGNAPQFAWDNPYKLAQELGIISTAAKDADFTRADVVTIVWNALGAKLNGSNKTLADRLIEQDVFTRTEYDEANEIKQYGEVQDHSGYGGSSSSSGSNKPTTPVSPSKPNTAYTYEDYLSWTPVQREEHMNTFGGDYIAYFAWYNAAEKAYKNAQADKDVTGDGNLNIGDLMKP